MQNLRLICFTTFLIFASLMHTTITTDYISSLGLTSLPPVLVVANSNTMLLGLQNIDGISLKEGNRILLINQTLQSENGIWIVHPGSWTRPIDFANDTATDNCFVLAISGNNYTGSNWICNTPNALIGTNNITFVEVHLSNQISVVNVGEGTGQIFQGQSDTTFNLKTIAAGDHLIATNNVNEISLTTDANSANIANTIVTRDILGNFSASTINANLTGNVVGNVTGNVIGNLIGNLSGNISGNITGNVNGNATTADTATNFSGALAGDVAGTQSATTIESVGGQSAVNIATATALSLAATNSTIASTIVKRDPNGNFTTNKITLNGTITNPNDVATKAYVDSVAALGLEPHEPAIVVATSNIVLTGLQTIDGVTLVDGNRVLLISQINSINNGLWLAHSGSWTRPSDFASGTEVGADYILVLSGAVNTGSSWLCSTPTAFIGTDLINFIQFSLPSQTTASNVGSGNGQLFKDKTGVTLNFKTVATGPHLTAVNNANDITINIDATNINAANTVVKRDDTGCFAANTVNANLVGNVQGNVIGNLTGNASTATNAINFIGNLTGDISGTQNATIVSTVGGQSASNIASATVTANNASNLNTYNTIVKRDDFGNFSANNISSNLIGNVIGSSSLNVLKTGDNMSGVLQLSAGTSSKPALTFAGSASSGLSAPSTNTLSFSSDGIEQMNIDTTSINAITKLVLLNLLCNQAIQIATPVNNGSVTANSTTSLLLLNHTSNITNYTINFPANPTNGQFFTIMLGTTSNVNMTSIAPDGATIINSIKSFNPNAFVGNSGGTSVTYMYISSTNSWYRYSRG